MASFNISLSDELRRYVLAQIAGGAYGNVSEYFRSLIRDHQRQTAQERLESLLLEGIQSGNAGPMSAAEWEELRQEALKRAANRNQKTGVSKKARKQDPPGAKRPG